MSVNLFNSIRVRKPKRNKFNLSHDVKLSCDMGQLIPFLCQDIVPGDTWRCNSEIFLRFAPLIAPVMHRVNVYTHFFFVPKRLVWDDWKTFITGGPEGNDIPSYPRIRIPASSSISGSGSLIHGYGQSSLFCPGSLADYLGFPVQENVTPVSPSVIVDALPFRAYTLIYNEYYRDQNVQDEFFNPIDTTFNGIYDAQDVSQADYVKNLLNIKYRAWQKDYFTSALPWPQRGDDVTLPFVGDADVVLSDKLNPGFSPEFVDYNRNSLSGAVSQSSNSQNPDGANAIKLAGNSNSPAFLDPNGTLKADMSNVSSATISEFRRALKAQEFLELRSRGGSRYIEQIYAFFGVKSSDSRLQRPEYLGGGKTPVVISDVLQTSQTTDTSPQAQPSGNGVSIGRSNSFKRFFEEHGYLIGIMSVMPVPCYQQGMPRQFTKFDPLDHYWPQFSHLGEQEIKNSEIYFKPGDVENDDTFGYAPRYAEYKFINSSVHGDFRNSLNFWHMGRIFNSRPYLNSTFINFQKGSADRVFAVENPTGENINHLWVSVRNNINALRPMPKYGTPML